VIDIAARRVEVFSKVGRIKGAPTDIEFFRALIVGGTSASTALLSASPAFDHGAFSLAGVIPDHIHKVSRPGARVGPKVRSARLA